MKNLPKIFIVLLGICVIAFAFYADSLDLGGRYSAEGFGKSQWALLLLGAVLIALALFSNNVCKIISINISIFLTLLLVVDNALYFFSPHLPKNLQVHLSEAALVRTETYNYKLNLQGRFVFDYDYYWSYWGTPFFEDYWDEFGYRNPVQYITDNEIDILLIGDSFTEGLEADVTVADYLRKSLPQYKTYSLGMSGQGLAHWHQQLDRYFASEFFKKVPEIVILNFYFGNDVGDTRQYVTRGKYYKKAHFSFYGEVISLIQRMLFYNYDDGLPDMIADEFTISQIPNAEKTKTSKTAPEPSEKESKDYTVVPAVYEEVLQKEEDAEIIFPFLKKAVESIRAISPDTRIVLSYIAASNTIYSDSTNAQKQNSDIIRQWAQTLNIDYLDSMNAIREHAKKEIIHETDLGAHFNEKGNKLYSDQLFKKIVSFNSSSSEPVATFY